MTSVRTDINQVLMQMRAIKNQVQPKPTEFVPPGAKVSETSNTQSPLELKGAKPPAFSEMLVDAVNQVAETQQQAGNLAKAFEVGDPNVSLSQVMVASEKASVSFQAMTQVRNKLVEAYKDVMNMPI